MTDEEIRLKIAELKGYVKGVGRMDIAYHCGFDWRHTPTGGKTSILPEWPVDIAAAWELVEEMKQIGGAVCIEWTTEFIDAPFKWWCGANVPQDYKVKPFTSKWHSGRADTAPRAICLAYIAWKEAQ